MYKILANSLFLGKEVIYMPSCHSTNDIASELVRHTDKSEGLIVVTNEQKKGKGQRGNVWESESGKNLTFSLLLKPTFLKIEQQFFLNMIISMSVAEVVSDLLKSESKIQVKWPNDVLIEQKKVCGILIENSLIGGKIGHSIIGVGLNVNQYNFLSPNATSMLHYYKEELSLSALLEKLVLRIENNYLHLKQGRFDMVKQCYLDRLYGYNAPIHLLTDHEFKGQIVDITSEGRVVILHEGGKSIFDFKELKFILA